MSEFAARNLANTAWAFALAFRQMRHILQSWHEQLEAHERVMAQNLANTAWAFAFSDQANAPQAS